MTNKFRNGAAGVALIAALGMSTAASAADSETATAEAEVLTALTLVVAEGSILDFGQVAVNGGGTIVLDPTDESNPTCSANLVCIGDTFAVNFEITGQGDQDVGISLPTSAVDLVRAGGVATNAADKLELSSFVSNDADDVVTLDVDGDGGFAVGGTLTFDGSEIAGTYSGMFAVTVEYQ
ncbi:DUF4402 domain-containing protein [Altererythrobacter aquiaggeris]|uniref:DUF4402 domain-containing protein n=1 Tax=Aestuarierythrobacter aquiaggeris TaxID=1898396 RepID=UPI00301611B9